MDKFTIHYETHIHKLDGTYDRKIAVGIDLVDENHVFFVYSVQDLNKILEYSVYDILKYLKRGIREREFSFIVTKGFTDINGIYHFDKIFKVENVIE